MQESMKKALIVIDYVNDFVEDAGKLTCGAPAQRIDARLAELVEAFAREGGLVVAACDWHQADEAHGPERKLFPPHCIAGTRGAEPYGRTGKALAEVPQKRFLRIEKQRYSAFAGTALDMKLRERGITELHLAGVCTDICVLHAAVDAYNLGYATTVHADAVATFNPAGHEFALKHFKETLGFQVVSAL